MTIYTNQMGHNENNENKYSCVA